MDYEANYLMKIGFRMEDNIRRPSGGSLETEVVIEEEEIPMKEITPVAWKIDFDFSGGVWDGNIEIDTPSINLDGSSSVEGIGSRPGLVNPDAKTSMNVINADWVDDITLKIDKKELAMRSLVTTVEVLSWIVPWARAAKALRVAKMDKVRKVFRGMY